MNIPKSHAFLETVLAYSQVGPHPAGFQPTLRSSHAGLLANHLLEEWTAGPEQDSGYLNQKRKVYST